MIIIRINHFVIIIKISVIILISLNGNFPVSQGLNQCAQFSLNQKLNKAGGAPDCRGWNLRSQSARMDENKSTKSLGQNAYDIIVDYSGYSSLAGLIFVFMTNLPSIGRVIMYLMWTKLQFFWNFKPFFSENRRNVFQTDGIRPNCCKGFHHFHWPVSLF